MRDLKNIFSIFIILLVRVSHADLNLIPYEKDEQRIRAFRLETKSKFSIAQERCSERNAVLPGTIRNLQKISDPKFC